MLSLAQAGTEPPAGVEPKPREEPPTGCQGHEGLLTKGLVKNIHPALRNSSMSHCDTKHHNQPSKQYRKNEDKFNNRYLISYIC